MDAINISHLSFRYLAPEFSDVERGENTKQENASRSMSGAQIFDDVSWNLASGEFCLLEGSTGSGKTTLLRLLHPTLAPRGERTGQVNVCGYPFSETGSQAQEIISRVGYVAQNPASQIVCDSVWHELAFGLENENTPQDQMRRRVAEVAHYFGIEPWFNKPTSELSGGQAQVLNLAAVLCRHPQLLLLDEPTSQLDPVSAANFAHALFRINRELQVSVLVATHSPEVLRDYATKEVHLNSGKIYGGPLPQKPVPAQFVPVQSVLPQKPVSAQSAPRPSAPSQTKNNRSNAKPLISMKDVWFRYQKDNETVKPKRRRKNTLTDQTGKGNIPFDCVLRNCTWSCAPRSIHALVGGNGCGKTTLLLLAACAYTPLRGRVSNTSHAQAYLPQDPQALFGCETVYDELREWQKNCGYQESDIAHICASLNIPYTPHADQTHKPSQLHGFEAQNPHDLSGGEQQLLALAKLILTKPDLLLLDEPTKGLDSNAHVRVIHLLKDISLQGTTIVLSTHNMALVLALADTVSMIFDGQIASCEPTDAFFSENLFFRPRKETCERLGIHPHWRSSSEDDS